MTAASLERFFAEMAELLAGRRTAAQVEAVLGPSPSGTPRLGAYATLVDRQLHGVIDSFFRAATVAATSWDRPRFAELRRDYWRTHPPSTWSPIAAVVPFADYLAAHAAPVDVIELADLARTRHQVLEAPPSDGIHGLAVGHYTHAVHDFTVAVERGEVSAGRPAAVPSTLLLGRHRETASLVVITPSLASLVALQVIDDRTWSSELPAVDPAEVVAAAVFLADQGLLAPAALTVLRACV